MPDPFKINLGLKACGLRQRLLLTGPWWHEMMNTTTTTLTEHSSVFSSKSSPIQTSSVPRSQPHPSELV